MMYQEKLAVAIKSNGKVLREFKDTVYVPFGSEYSLLIKNLNAVKALIHITIDGQDVVEGGLVLRGNESIDLERFIKDGNLQAGNRFKFIERTSKVEQHRGIGLEDGLIRVEFEFEKPYVLNNVWGGPYVWYSSSNGSGTGINPQEHNFNVSCNTVSSSSAFRAGTTQSFGASATITDVSDIPLSNVQNDAGITVAGSISSQKFETASWFPTDGAKHVMVLKLLGELGQGQRVTKPVTVKTKQKCPTCDTVNKATTKFCRECGTGLQLV